MIFFLFSPSFTHSWKHYLDMRSVQELSTIQIMISILKHTIINRHKIWNLTYNFERNSCANFFKTCIPCFFLLHIPSLLFQVSTQTDRQTDRHTDRQTDRQTETDRQTHILTQTHQTSALHCIGLIFLLHCSRHSNARYATLENYLVSNLLHDTRIIHNVISSTILWSEQLYEVNIIFFPLENSQKKISFLVT
jgi:hypothetical protein